MGVTVLVALRKESVDRKFHWTVNIQRPTVALRKESVDRKVNLRVLDGSKSVALRKESVDRKTQRRDFKALGLPSLSARRAWIEKVLWHIHWPDL